MNKTHKFFDRHLDNDLDEIKSYLDKKLDEILSGNLFEIDLSKPAIGNPGWLDKSGESWTRFNGAATQLGNKYNLLNEDILWINNLKKSLKDMVIEACKYYEINFEDQNYHATAWFNYDYGLHKYDPQYLHDHSGGNGIPDFHGYYCIDAEPSSTYYHIGKSSENEFENVNYNNRAIVSETGHPHARGDWNSERPRITVAYDILPFKNGNGGHFVKL